MLKKTFAILMLGAAFSAPSWADHGPYYGRVIQVEPAVSIGFHDGRSHFQIMYGGERYWTYPDYPPSAWIAVPPPRFVYRYDDDRRPYRWHEWEHDRWERHHHHDDWDDGHHDGWRHRDHDWD